jgi:hypothetical protein
MATDKDYRIVGLTAQGVKNARRIDEWLELIVDEVTGMVAKTDPWEVRDFIVCCATATALSDQRVKAHLSKKGKKKKRKT